MTDVKICNNKKIIKLNDYFYMSPEGDILKYKKYCVINDCKKLASFNYHNEKTFLYCNEHKSDNMINIKRVMFYVLFLSFKLSYYNEYKSYLGMANGSRMRVMITKQE